MQRLRQFICAVFAVFLLLLPISALAASGDTIVYITDTGERYHQTWCQYLSQSKHEVTLQEAVNRGLTPCKVCKPPELTTVGNGTRSISGGQESDSTENSDAFELITTWGIPAAAVLYGMHIDRENRKYEDT